VRNLARVSNGRTQRDDSARAASRPRKAASPFSQELKALRSARGMTQKQLAQAAGVSGSHVALIELGERRPSPEALERFAVALRCTREEQRRLLDAYATDLPSFPTRTGRSLGPRPAPEGAIAFDIDDLHSAAVRLATLAANQRELGTALELIRAQVSLPQGSSSSALIGDRLVEAVDTSRDLERRINALADIFTTLADQLNSLDTRVSNQFS
jgi:transcriptional regulator with XRE-family HTH domain